MLGIKPDYIFLSLSDIGRNQFNFFQRINILIREVAYAVLFDDQRSFNASPPESSIPRQFLKESEINAYVGIVVIVLSKF